MYYAYTRKIPATDTQGARIHVTIQGRKTTVAYNYTVNDAHEYAIQQIVGPDAKITLDVATARGWRYKVEDAE